MLVNKNKRSVQSIKIKSIQANSLYLVNNYNEDREEENAQTKPYLDLGEAVINDSLFADYMKHHGVTVNSKGRSRDFIVMKFDFGVKGGMSAAELREYYYENGATVKWKFYDEPIHYKMLMRSPGKAKEGDCIFIREKFYSKAIKYLTMDLWDKMPRENAPIVEMSAYAPLTTATAIDYITIPMENILIVKDEDVYTMVNAVRVKAKDIPYGYNVVDWEKVEEIVNGYGFTFYKKKQEENPGLQYINSTKTALKEKGIEIENYPLKTKVGYKTGCYVDRPKEKTKVKNTLWDGMGLVEESAVTDGLFCPKLTDIFCPDSADFHVRQSIRIFALADSLF